MSIENSRGRVPGIAFGTTNLERVLRIFQLKEQNLSSSDIAKQLGMTRQAIDYHLSRNADFISQYRTTLETLEVHKDSDLIPEDLRGAIQRTLSIFPKLAAA
jgi:predicted DNA-binding protein YlxM (UPF0122 family)